MRFIIALMIVLVSFSCNQGKQSGNQADADTANTPVDSMKKITEDSKDSLAYSAQDSALLQASVTLLQIFSKKDMITLSSFIHAREGLRFSPYGYVDTTTNKVLSAAQLIELAKKGSKINWGSYDGSGEPILMSLSQYFERFVYDKDFLNAEKSSVNRFLGSGNSLNNLRQVYPGASFTEFYFSGFDPKYDGMDWRSIRLVFKTEAGKNYLIGIVHDEWTI